MSNAMKRALLVCAVVLTASAGALYFVARRVSAKPTDHARRGEASIEPGGHRGPSRAGRARRLPTLSAALGENAGALRGRPPVGREEARQASARAAVDLLERHGREAVDRDWATNTRQALEADLTALGSRAGFTVGPVDCRTTLCTAVLAWPSGSEAQRAGALIARHAFQANCTRALLGSAPNDPGAPFSAPFFLDCSAQRR